MKEAGKQALASRIKILRWLVLRILKVFSFDIVIKNPYSESPFKLNSYKHKGYWYYGGSREEDTINSIKSLVKDGDVVIEVGGHIGFITHLYSSLVGSKGSVEVFEPGLNNLSYIQYNTASLDNTRLHNKGCGQEAGEFDFFQDSVGGQNNSLLDNHPGLDGMAKTHFEKNERIVVSIEVILLKDFIEKLDKPPGHIKIDVEGAELQVLLGLGSYLGTINSFMVEINRDHQEVMSLMDSAGYDAFDDRLKPLMSGNEHNENVFFVRREGREQGAIPVT